MIFPGWKQRKKYKIKPKTKGEKPPTQTTKYSKEKRPKGTKGSTKKKKKKEKKEMLDTTGGYAETRTTRNRYILHSEPPSGPHSPSLTLAGPRCPPLLWPQLYVLYYSYPR